MQTLNGEKQALWKAWRRKNQSEWQTALECRAIGQHWANIKAIIKARGGRRTSRSPWRDGRKPTHPSPIGGLTSSVASLIAGRNFAQPGSGRRPYRTYRERLPVLHGFVDLINTKAQLDHVSGERALNRSETNGPPNAGVDVKLKEPDARHAPQRGTLRLSLAGALASGEPSTSALPVLV
jgi:hypothetical protein